jgi:carboxymethylenebutenolidase
MTDDELDKPVADEARRERADTSATTQAGSALPVVEVDVFVATPDGRCDAVFLHPESGAHPGVLIWPDAFGLRPVMRDLARRLAAEGYAVLVPNPFYRSAKAPVLTGPFSFQNPADRAKLGQLVAPLHAPGATQQDAGACIAFLDAQPQVDTAKPIGTQGYCMGGALAVRTAAALPQRLGAVASFHGGSLVTEQPDSPHLLAPLIRARMYFGIAANDDTRQPEAKDVLREAFATAHVPAEIEVYAGALHGWCIPDMPVEHGAPIYNAPAAERAWGKLLDLYRQVLV